MIVEEFWAHQFHDNPKLLDQIEDEDFDLDAVIAAMTPPDGWEPVT